MDIQLRKYNDKDLISATELWNEIIEMGNSFPGDKVLSYEETSKMFKEQTETICAIVNEEIVGLYILHPNGIGRCSHISNASYAVKEQYRGKGIGKLLVEDSINRAKEHEFKGLQFNAVVASNYGAISLYLKLGFQIIGMIKNGYHLADDSYQDTIIFLKSW